MFRLLRPSRLAHLLLTALVLLGASPAAAAVEIAFYSRELGTRFPHAFVTLKGTLDRGGAPIDTNWGFSATSISPAILMGAVKGAVYSETPGYIADSNRHFRMSISDAEYDKVMATVQKWRDLKQPSYHLNKQNCVFFVADVAASLGMAADTSGKLMKKPTSYLASVTAANRPWLLARGAVIEGKSSSK
jgi:hypothetical protein